MGNFNYNKIRGDGRKEYYGGTRDVYGGKAQVTLPTGYSVPLGDLPKGDLLKPNVIPAGTPFYVDDENKMARPHYAFPVHSPVTSGATQVQVKKGVEGTRARVGMFLLHFPTTEENIGYRGDGVAITAIDSSNEGFDILTVSAALPALVENDILVEATQAGSGAMIFVIPTATSYADIPVYGDETCQMVDLVTHNNVLYTRRTAPIHPAIRAYMYANGYFVRFYDGI
jgi:hypothetical protein